MNVADISLEDKIERMQVNELIPYHNNPKEHPEEQINRLASSIKNYGFLVPLVVDSEGEVVAGHGRLDAAKKLGLDELPVIRADHLSDAQVKAFRLADNRVAESGWDYDSLAVELDELENDFGYDVNDIGFSDDELDEIFEENSIEDIDEVESNGLPEDLNDWRILNLYAGIGGNRKFWPDEADVVAVEYNEEIAKAYQDFFPDDEVIVDDAHDYLLNHFQEFDFIWSSPPCPTHSKIRKNSAVASGKSDPVYPDMRLYKEILLLNGYSNSKYCVENVKSWYDPLIEPIERGPHYFWTNFSIPKVDLDIGENKHNNNPKRMEEYLGFDLSKYSFSSNYPKQKILNNCIHPKLGEYILESAYKSISD